MIFDNSGFSMSLPTKNVSKMHNVPFFLPQSPAGIFMVDETYFDLHFIHLHAVLLQLQLY